jgi:hypothetical protein
MLLSVESCRLIVSGCEKSATGRDEPAVRDRRDVLRLTPLFEWDGC